ncbi:MAG: hypothetical protein GYB67_05050, partial [Chloroflexi bacterium]|nr:hypothetical protein [Chloroflexota bacterium]
MTTQLMSPMLLVSEQHLASRLDALAQVSGLDSALIAQFGDFIRTAPDEDLFRASPYRYAQRVGIGDRQAVDLFLYATHAGILEFNWGVLCPRCAAFITSPGGLRSLHTHAYCDLCQIDSDVVIDDNVEVAFTVAPSVRTIRFHSPSTINLKRDWRRLFFSTSQTMTPFVLRQIEQLLVADAFVPANAIYQFEHMCVAGQYLIALPQHHAQAALEVDPQHAEHTVHFDLLDGAVVPARQRVGPGPVIVRVHNRTDTLNVVGLIHRPLAVTLDPDAPES